MRYKKALVFFIDILGSQTEKDFNRLLDINKTFHHQLENNKKNDKVYTIYERFIYTFSDCAYIIYDFKENIDEDKKDLSKLFEIALYNTEGLIIQFLKKGFLCRGGVSYNDVYYEKERSLFFGPAINIAHQYECKHAKYPRIIVDNEIANEVIKLNQERILNAADKDREELLKSINGNIVKQDEDKLYYLHYFNRLELGIDYRENMLMYADLILLISNEIRKQEECISKNPDDRAKCERIILKFEWFKNYLFNSMPSHDSGAISLNM